MPRIQRDAYDLDPLELEGAMAAPGVAPGKRSLTQGLAPRPIVFRVASAEAARELGAAFGRRDGNGVAEGAEAAVDRAASGGGEPLRADLRDRFETSLGADLAAVRVHRSAASADANAAVGAKAYTVGNDIHFGAGQYQPDDPFGMHLLAHEVAHTQQQAGGPQRRQHQLEVSTPGDAAEVEADRAADAMVSGQAASIGAHRGGVDRSVQRKADDASPAASPEAGAPIAGAAPPPQVPSWYQHPSNANADGEIEARIFFGTDSADLTPDDLAAIEAFVKRWDGMLQNGDWELEVLGFADQRHTEAHNFDLSAKRAAKVMDELKKRLTKGLPEQAEFFGEGEVPSSNNPDDLARSRRVEIRVRRWKNKPKLDPDLPIPRPPGPPSEPSRPIPSDWSTEWELTIGGSASVLAAEATSLTIKNLKSKETEEYLFMGGGGSLSAVPIGLSGKGGPYPFTTSAPVPTKVFAMSVNNWHFQAAAGAPGMDQLIQLLKASGIDVDGNTLSGEYWVLTGPRAGGADVVFLRIVGGSYATPNLQAGGVMGPLL